MTYIKIKTTSNGNPYVELHDDKHFLLNKVYFFNIAEETIISELPITGCTSIVLNNKSMPLKQRRKVNMSRHEAFIVYAKKPNRYDLYIPCSIKNIREIFKQHDYTCLSVGNIIEFSTDVNYNEKGYKNYTFNKEKNELHFIVKTDDKFRAY